jgi:hypothetical protein
MLVSADKFYGVLFNNQKISSIRSIKREEAMEFVDQVRFNFVIYAQMLTVKCVCEHRRPRHSDFGYCQLQ